MHFSSALVALVSLASFAIADVHTTAVCVDENNGYEIYNANATIAACDAYLKSNTGTESYQSCPDCTMITTGTPPYCQSTASHIGGKEVTQFCRDAGAGNALTA